MLCTGLGTRLGEGRGTWEGPTGPAAPGRGGEARGVCVASAAKPRGVPWEQRIPQPILGWRD